MTRAYQAMTVTRPALALVFGSGGVRSAAGLGMVEVLAEEGIQPDLLVGTSAGAMFAASIAMGHTPAQAVKIACTLWTSEVARQPLWQAIPRMLFPRLGRFDGDFALRCDDLIMTRLEHAFGDTRLEDLPLPLRVTATLADSGAAVTIASGRIVDALRASIAIPFMFAPHHVDGQRLSDGFVSDPLPVAAAAEARSVIALRLNAPMPQQIIKPARLLAQVTSAMTNNLMQARLDAAQAQGMRLLCVRPQLEHRVGLFDTHAMPYLVDQGRHATRQMLPAIFALLERKPHLVAA